eukprot:4012742-Amphidinium_carterae.1
MHAKISRRPQPHEVLVFDALKCHQERVPGLRSAWLCIQNSHGLNCSVFHPVSQANSAGQWLSRVSGVGTICNDAGEEKYVSVSCVGSGRWGWFKQRCPGKQTKC